MMNAATATLAAALAASVSSSSSCRRRTSSSLWSSTSAFVSSSTRGSPFFFVLRQDQLLGNQSTTTATTIPTTLGGGTPCRRRRRRPCLVRCRCCRAALCLSARCYDSCRSFGTQLPSPKQRKHPQQLALWTVNETTGIVSRRAAATAMASSSSSSSSGRHGVMQQYQVVVGFEIHVQLVAGSSSINYTRNSNKLFSGGTGTDVVVPANASTHDVRPVRSPSSTISATPSTSSTPPNTMFHPFDAAVPGYLPLLKTVGARGHPTVVHQAVAAAILCQSDVQRTSRFERKHYYYADLPHGYQITQQRWPIARGGFLPSSTSAAATENDTTTDTTRCRIDRMQLEMDTAKTTTTTTMATGRVQATSWIDVDRAGTALLEIVTLPDIRSPQHAVTLVQNLHSLLTHSGVTKGRMELGEFRIDVNVNLENRITGERNGRVEIKNLNSFAQIRDSIVYEAIRQATEWWSEMELDESNDDDRATATTNRRGGPETRTWDAALQQTVLLRRKDTAQEYRFLPEPDLPPIEITDAFVDHVRASLPELPSQTIERLMSAYGISEYQASTLVREGSFDAAKLLEDTCNILLLAASSTNGSAAPKLSTMVANLVVNELFALLQAEATITSSHHGDEEGVWRPIEAWQLSEIVEMLHDEVISLAVAKKLLGMVVVTPRSPPLPPCSPRQIVKDRGWELVTDRDALLATCRQVLEAHPKQADEYVTCTMESLASEGKEVAKARRNQQRLTKLLMGMAVSALGGKAHPERLHEALQEALEELVASKRPSSSSKSK